MKIFKKVLATILCVVMVFGSAPLAGFVGLELPSIGDIFTTKAEAATSGTCGDNLTWTFDESTGELVISGTGDMDNWSNYLSEFCAPWYSNRLNIKTLTILDGVTSIGNYAFYNLTSLTNITIPDSVISIGNGAFLSCSDFKSITIPDGVTSIGDSAFESCSNLRGITIPDSVTHVGVSVFESCNNLGNSGSVKIGSGLTAISDSMFYNCDCLYSVTIPYGITSIGDSAFSNSECFSSVTIPESVTSIGHSAFFYCDSLYRITVPESVTSIGSNAFYNTSYYKNSSNWENNLLYIGNCLINAKSSVSGDCSIKEGTIVIADNVFRYCESLTSVTIPDSVTSIGNGVFNGCDSLERIEIGKGVTNIDVLAFNNCKNLTSITVNSGNLYYSSDESGVLYNKDKTDIIKYPAGKTDTTYVVSDNVMGICDYAFSDCVNLTSIEIGKGVTNIGKAIFKGSLNLTSITVDPSNTYYITDEFGTLYDINKTEIIKYPATKEIASYTIPDSVIIVADYSFENCLSLKSVIIGNSVTTIGDYAFTNCENLTSITIGSGLKIVGNYAFEYCLKLENIVFPDGFKVMGHYVFSDCENLTRVTIPDSITNIGDLPFLACYKSPAFYYTGTPEQWVNVVYYGISKDDIVFESNSEKPYFYDDYGENLTWKLYTSTGELVFYGVGDMKDRASNSGAPWYRRENIIKSITISDGITSIGAYAFRGMSFESLTIPASLKSVGVSAFYESALINIYYKGDLSGWCNINFESDAFTVHNYAGNLFICGKLLMGDVVIPDGVTRIPNYAFYNCSSIKSVTIPDSVKSIGYSAFKSCSGLKSITIPDSVSSIGSNAFCLCSSLSKIELSKNIKSIGTKTFYGCNSLKSIIIPDSVASIDYMAFSECRSLTNVIIGDGVTYIGSFAFDWCTNLKNITIPSGITRWGDEPFRACYSIENVYFTGEISDWCEMSFNGSFYPLEMGGNLYINGELLKVLELPDSMSNIEKYSFDNCKSLTKVIFPDNFIVVGEGAFTSCSNILEVRIGKDTQLIKKDAFYGCNKIETVYYPGTLEEWNEITILDGNDSLKNAKIIFDVIPKHRIWVKALLKAVMNGL